MPVTLPIIGRLGWGGILNSAISNIDTRVATAEDEITTGRLSESGLSATFASRQVLHNNLGYYTTGAGIADEASAFVLALADTADYGVLEVPQPAVAYRMASTVTLSRPVKIVGAELPKLIVDIPDADGATPVFDITADDVTIEGLWFSGEGKTGTPTGNRYLVRALGTSDVDRILRPKVTGCRFTDLLTNWYAGTLPATTAVVHGFYCDFVTGPQFNDNDVDSMSGAACFYRRTRRSRMLHNDVVDTGWYSLHLDGGNVRFEVAHNSVENTLADGVYWGALIDVMGQNANAYGSDVHGRIHHNYLAGKSGYGNDGAVRLSSSAHVEVDNNTFDGIGNLSCVSVHMRQSSGNTNGAAPKHIRIHHNHAIASGAGQCFVLAQNGQTGLSGGIGPIGSAEGLAINDNTLENVDASNYFACLAQINGQNGGWSAIRVSGNVGKGNPQSVGSLEGGFVSVLGNPDGLVFDVRVEGNNLTFDDMAGGAASSSADSGVQFGPYVSSASARSNRLRGFYYGTRALSNTGPAIDIYDNDFASSVSLDVLMDASVVATSRKMARAMGIFLATPTGSGGTTVTAGAGTPEGSQTASPGSVHYDQTNGVSYFKWTGSGATGWAANGVPARTAAQIQAASDPVNTIGKTAGRMIYDTSNTRVLFASGTTATSAWKDGAGTTVYTPA